MARKKPLIGIIDGEGKMGSWFRNFVAKRILELTFFNLK